jgi:iron complex transport system substrate-binding protein
MRICSLLPSATEVLAGLGLADNLVAISHECDYPPEITTKPVVIESTLRHETSSSAEIDRQVGQALQAGTGLYTIKEELLRECDPTLIITQDLCEVCAVTPTEVQRAVAVLRDSPRIISLNPKNLDDVFRDILLIGEATGRERDASDWVCRLKDRIAVVQERLTARTRRRVACLEWLDPLYTAGHWVPELVASAGGIDVLAAAGTHSTKTSWEAVCAAQPEVLILMPCGFGLDRTFGELALLRSRPGWADLPAVIGDAVYAVDGPAYFNRPGPRLVDGLELLAKLFHPDRVDDAPPAGARRVSCE